MTDHDLPGPGDQCLCGSYFACRCPPDPDLDGYLDASYEAGYGACEADGYDERPMTEWVYATHHRASWSAAERRVVFAMTEERFGELTWRHHHASAAAYARWFERAYGHDLGAYLAGFDDAGAGLPSAVSEPGRHALWAGALDAYERRADAGDVPVESWSPFAEGDDGLPF